MATAEEIMMAEAAEDTIYIDSDLRTINIPSTIKLLGVESDKDVNRLYFRMPAVYRGINLSNFEIRINYLNANQEGDVYEVTDNVVDGEYISFSWLVGGFALQYKGNVTFIVCVKEVDGNGVITREFNTTVASLPVLEGLETSKQVIQEHPDVLENILKRLSRIENSGTVTDEQVANAVENYFTAHPMTDTNTTYTLSVSGKDIVLRGSDGSTSKASFPLAEEVSV